VLREYASTGTLGEGSWSWVEDWVYRGSELLAGAVSDMNIRHYHLDHLGTPRLITGPHGTLIARHAYLPFGGQLSPTTQEHPRRDDPMKFTGHERDAATGLDYMHARYYSPTLGRFLSVDPGKDWDLYQPQSWNMFAYVRNNPVNAIDPTGKISYLVSRPLGASTGRSIVRRAAGDHMFIVTHARYPGDPKANVVSFGRSTEPFSFGRAGRVDTKTTGLSTDTFIRDKGEWRGLAQPSTSEAAYIAIPASDDRVKGIAEAVVPSHPYEKTGTNSNAIAQAVADTAAGQQVPAPGTAPKRGAGEAHQIQFDEEKLKRVPPQ
jgi:RHS repeat-associated protein